MDDDKRLIVQVGRRTLIKTRTVMVGAALAVRLSRCTGRGVAVVRKQSTSRKPPPGYEWFSINEVFSAGNWDAATKQRIKASLVVAFGGQEFRSRWLVFPKIGVMEIFESLQRLLEEPLS